MNPAHSDQAPLHWHHAEPSHLALRFGYAGLAPFVVGTMLIWLLAGRIEEEPFQFVAQGLAAYAALVVSLLGGAHWGLIMVRSSAGGEMPESHRRALVTGVTYPVGAWLALLMRPHASLVVLGFLLIGCYLTDRKRYPELGASGWLTLRFRLTVFASLCCFLAAAQL